MSERRCRGTRRTRLAAWALALLCTGLVPVAAHALAADVLTFSPQGTVKGAQQVTARFNTPMVALGDPRLAAPFDVDCAAPGRGRWLDPRNWVYDFEQPLPAGLRCRFAVRRGLTDLAGTRLAARTAFTFDTGGPTVLQSEPWAGAQIDEQQVFMLGLDGPVRPDSIEGHVYCRAEGLNEAIGVRLIGGDERARLLEANPWFLRRYAQSVYGERYGRDMIPASAAEEAPVAARFRALMSQDQLRLVLVQCRQRLPNSAKVSLDWGAGIASPTGLVTSRTASLDYETRPAFRAAFHCERVNKDADCIPALPMTVDFTAPGARERAARATLTGPDGRVHAPATPDDATATHVSSLTFPGPFTERARYVLDLPRDLTDDADRTLANAARFPREIMTDEDPPLARFAADFGIVELTGTPALPVTVRNLEGNLQRLPAAPPAPGPSVAGFVRELAATALGRRDDGLLVNPVMTTLRGRVLHFGADDPLALGSWLTQVRQAQQDQWDYDDARGEYVVTRRAGERSLLDAESRAQVLEVPRATHAKAFEVVAIPLAEPGFHLVELASPRLGASLFGKPGVYYTQSLALVTNLGVHFKWGRESSLVWVTALDSGRPVGRAAVTVKDCRGTTHWHGTTDDAGIARIARALPGRDSLPECEWNSRGLVAVARLGQDTGLVASEWNEGIANWQFNLPGPQPATPEIGHAVTDRSLFRAGETAHIKVYRRRHGIGGLGRPGGTPAALRVRHAATGDEYALSGEYDGAGTSATAEWSIPAAARLGRYVIEYAHEADWLPLGEFRVEHFRVPLARATLAAAATPAVAVGAMRFDAQVQFLAGGAAAGLPVKLRGLIEPRVVTFADYPGYAFMNGDVEEGLIDEVDQAWSYREQRQAPMRSRPLAALSATLDAAGGTRFELDALPPSAAAQTVVAELEYPDPNGEVLTTSARVPLWPASIALGIKPEAWAGAPATVRFTVQALDLAGRPRAGVAIVVDTFQRITYSHRKRLLGGFYAYEHRQEIKRVDAACRGSSDEAGRLSCTLQSPVSGNLILRASAHDAAGQRSVAQRDVWVAGADDWWYAVSNDDRMDLLPEERSYEPGATARLQVRMPFRQATALVTVEREGVVDAFVTRLDGSAPLVAVPIADHYAPNVFVSVLAVRGRDATVAPTATVDLGRPAWKLGVTELAVGRRAHALAVEVTTPHAAYAVRDTVPVTIAVTRADGSPLRERAEVALVAIDEGLLELAPNPSWQLLDAMLGRRGAEVHTATAQMQVIGKRHYGRKAVAAGGGGGAAGGTRSLFDTLLAWQARVPLDGRGRAKVEVPLNDSLTSFRIVAIANEGVTRFGTGATSVRSTQEVMLFSGLPPLVRAGDRLSANFTLRNAGERALDLEVIPTVTALDADHTTLELVRAPATQTVTLGPGEARELAFDVAVPESAVRLDWVLAARAAGDIDDGLRVSQRVVAHTPVRTHQALLQQLAAPLALDLALPADAVADSGEVALTFAPRLSGALAGVRAHMTSYPYTCLEQEASKAVALADEPAWQALVARLPAYLDARGFARYFAVDGPGSDTLTAYLLALAHESGWTLPDATHARMREALVQFIEGRVEVEGVFASADLAVRKLAAIAALSRYPDGINHAWLEALDIDLQGWPTSALLDWLDILRRSEDLPARDERRRAALAALRTRLDLTGTSLRFSSEASDALWWLMIDADVNANRALLAALDEPDWAEDVPRILVGSLARQRHGHWSTTVANAWGVLAARRFAERFETEPLSGTSRARLAARTAEIEWARTPEGEALALPWPPGPAQLALDHAGSGRPWVTVQARAAVALTEAFASGYRVERSVSPVTQAEPGRWQRGDVYRVRLTMTARSDMSWVVVADPVPAGASILGSGLGRDSTLGASDAADTGSGIGPLFEERSADGFRAYYQFVPRGTWALEYDVRLNSAGRFSLPATRVEAMYSPDLFGERPNAEIEVAR